MLVTRYAAEAFVDVHWELFFYVWWVVGIIVNVERVVVGFTIWAEFIVVEVKRDVEEVHDCQVCFYGYGQSKISFKHFKEFFVYSF